MAGQAGVGHTRNLPNYQNELFNITPSTARTLSVLGGLAGADTTARATDWTWQTTDNPAPAASGGLEGGAPTYENRDRAPAGNVFQQFKYGFDLSYEKQSATAQLAAPGAASDLLVANGMAGIASELQFQTDMKMKRLARDFNFSILQGTYQRPTDNATARLMRGLDVVADDANSTDTAAAAADYSATLFDTHVKAMFDAGAEFEQPLMIANSHNFQLITSVHGSDQPRSRTVGGVNIQMVVAPLIGDAMVLLDRDCPTDTVIFADASYLRVGILPIVNKGTVFVEPKPADGDSSKFMLFCSGSLKYGLPQYHGKISGTSTS